MKKKFIITDIWIDEQCQLQLTTLFVTYTDI